MKILVVVLVLTVMSADGLKIREGVEAMHEIK